ncbi:histidine phosphatase family protein [Candidatus Pelagibacter sp. HIMB1483]|uniref:histidine phosphatase family protein n=1 Tax=Candidatus Pelagibacter sp. HIMB1483 TaxID=3415414 RepID=UPI003F842519
MKKYILLIEKIFLYVCILIITFSSLVFLYEKKDKVITKLSRAATYTNYLEEDKKWFEEILDNPGYILFFRHAEREKWLDVKFYDAIELENNILAENSSFNKAVCLSSRGLEQAKIMGEYFKKINLNINVIVSSPSCRARQTAMLALGRIDIIENELVHYGPWNETEDFHYNNVRNVLLSVPYEKGENTIISAHNGVIEERVVDEYPAGFVFDLNEGGFYIISKDEDKLIVKHKFNNFHHFSKNILKRKINN